MSGTESDDIHRLQLDMVELKGDVKFIKQIQEEQSKQQEKTSKSQDDLTKAINSLITTIATEKRSKEGVRTTIKIIWRFVGSLILAVIITGSSLLINMKSELDVLQNEIVHLKKEDNE